MNQQSRLSYLTFQIATLGRGRRTFGGKIADEKLFSKALTAEEINELLQQEKGQF